MLENVLFLKTEMRKARALFASIGPKRNQLQLYVCVLKTFANIVLYILHVWKCIGLLFTPVFLCL